MDSGFLAAFIPRQRYLCCPRFEAGWLRAWLSDVAIDGDPSEVECTHGLASCTFFGSLPSAFDADHPVFALPPRRLYLSSLSLSTPPDALQVPRTRLRAAQY